MELKDRIAPYYLEYRGCYYVDLMMGDGLVFDKLDRRSLFVNLSNDGSISCREFDDDDSVFMYEVCDDSSLKSSARSVLMDLGIPVDKRFNLFDGNTNVKENISDDKRNRYIITIVNCLDMNPSNKEIVGKARWIWKDLEECDYNRYHVEGLSLYKMDESSRIDILTRFRLYENRGEELSYELNKYFKMKSVMELFKIVLKSVNDINRIIGEDRSSDMF